MICPYCGKEISDSSKFCRYCGQKQALIQSSLEPPAPVPPVSKQPETPVSKQPEEPVSPAPASKQPPLPEQSEMPAPPVQPSAPKEPEPPLSSAQPPVQPQPEEPVYSAEPVKPAAPSYPKAVPATPAEPPQKAQEAPRQSSGGKVLAIVLAVLLFLSVAANAYQYLTGRNSGKMLAAYAEESDSLRQELGQMDLERQSAQSRVQDAEQSAVESEALLAQRDSEIEALNEELAQWQQQAEALSSSQTTDAQNTILTALARFADESNPGGSSDIFKVSQPLMVLHKSSGQRRFVLTTDFDAGSIISMETTGDAADVAFTESSWGTATDMTVTPQHAGVVWASFTNDSNAYTITMLIVVLDD